MSRSHTLGPVAGDERPAQLADGATLVPELDPHGPPGIAAEVVVRSDRPIQAGEALTAIANALRVGDHLLDRLGAPSAPISATDFQDARP